jgi:hypothetical protein
MCHLHGPGTGAGQTPGTNSGPAQVPAILLEDEFKEQNQCEHEIKQARDPYRTYPNPAHHNFNLGGLQAAENQ